MADETIFEAPKPDSEHNADTYLDKYVGEGKKYKTVEDLAKGYANADEFIPKIKGNFDELKEFVAAQFKTKAQEPPAKPNEEPQREKPAGEAPPKETVDVKALIKEALEQKDETDRVRKNFELTEAVMVEKFGSKDGGKEALQRRAAELGVGEQFLADTAARSPQAFFDIMKIDVSKSKSTPNSDPGVALDKTGLAGPKTGTYAWYNNLRKTDPHKYFSAPIQNALMKDAMERGDAFFKT